MELTAPLNYSMAPELILKLTPPDHIHRPGSFNLRQLGETSSDAL